MSNKEITMNNRKQHHNTLRHILRALVCLVLLAVCVPGMGETVSAATKYTEYGRLVFSASKKKGVEQEKSDMPVFMQPDKSNIDEGYHFTTEVEGTVTIIYTIKNLPKGNVNFVSVYDANTEERVMSAGARYSIDGHSASGSESEVLSPSTYVISSQFSKKTSATISIYFLPTVNSITFPDMTMQTGDSVPLMDVLSVDPEEYLDYCKSQATWTSSDKEVATVDKKGKVTAKSVGTATITMETPDDTEETATITVAEPVEGAIEITPTTVQLSKETYTYSGKANKPKVTVLDQDGKEIPSDLVMVNYYNNINAGTAEAAVAVSGGTRVLETGETYVYHAATFTKTYTIKAAKAKKVTVPKKSISYKYSADGQKQKVTVYDSKGKKIDSSNYTVSYNNTNHVGKVKVTVQMNKNYGSKTLKTTYTIKANSMTTKLFPKQTYYKYSDGDTSVSYSYNKMSAKNLKKLLPYGDVSIVQGLVYNGCAYSNRTIYREIDGYGTSGQSLEFTGTIGDLIQSCIQGKIKKITYASPFDYDKTYRITCEDGKQYVVTYNSGRFGLKSGYVEVSIHDEDYNIYAVAYIKP